MIIPIRPADSLNTFYSNTIVLFVDLVKDLDMNVLTQRYRPLRN